MSLENFSFYAEANIVCAIIFGILLFYDLRKNDRQEKQLKFDQAIAANILYFICDIFWAAVLAGKLPHTTLAVASFNFINYILLSAIAYNWFLFAAASENLPIMKSKRGRMLIRLPFIVMTFVIIIAYITDPEFWISPSGELNSLYYIFMTIAPLIYVITAFILSIKNAFKKENYINRTKFLLIGIYPLLLAAIGVLQTFTTSAPLFCFGNTIIFVIFYIQDMQDMISLDPLTKLNNRGQLIRYASQPANLYKDGFKTFIVMIDLNDFKMINDTFGHYEGDHALVLTAEALKELLYVYKESPFLGRYGGDEFILVLHVRSESEMAGFDDLLRKALLKKCLSHQTPYMISAGVGYEELHKSGDTFNACLKRADSRLYDDKKMKKA